MDNKLSAVKESKQNRNTNLEIRKAKIVQMIKRICICEEMIVVYMYI